MIARPVHAAIRLRAIERAYQIALERATAIPGVTRRAARKVTWCRTCGP